MAFVFGVIASSMALGSMLKVLGSTSINTGVSRSSEITSTVAAKVKSAVITSSLVQALIPLKRFATHRFHLHME